MINIETLREAILPEFEDYFKDITIKIISPPSSELIPKIFLTLGGFVEKLEIDLNQKTIDFYEFPSQSVKNIKYLSFKKHGYEFEKLVELFLNVEHLKVQAEEFKNVKSNLVRQKDLKSCEICCYLIDQWCRGSHCPGVLIASLSEVVLWGERMWWYCGYVIR